MVATVGIFQSVGGSDGSPTSPDSEITTSTRLQTKDQFSPSDTAYPIPIPADGSSGYENSGFNYSYWIHVYLKITGGSFTQINNIKFWSDGAIGWAFGTLGELRRGDRAVVIENCDDTWLAKANVTCDTDTGDKKEGTASSRMIIADAFTTGLIATEVISSLNLATFPYIRFWIKSTINLSAGDLQIMLDDTEACASPIETLNLPALSANVWKSVWLKLADASLCTAIISVGLNATTDFGVATIRIDWIDGSKEIGCPMDTDYDVATGVGAGGGEGLSGDPIEDAGDGHGYYNTESVKTRPVQNDTVDSKPVVDSSNHTSAEKCKAILLQVKVDDDATQGEQTDKTLAISYDEI